MSLKDRRTYTGYTKDIKERLKRHNEGRVVATRNRRPLEIMYQESFEKEKDAKASELWWKSSAGRKKMKELFF